MVYLKRELGMNEAWRENQIMKEKNVALEIEVYFNIAKHLNILGGC